MSVPESVRPRRCCFRSGSPATAVIPRRSRLWRWQAPRPAMRCARSRSTGPSSSSRFSPGSCRATSARSASASRTGCRGRSSRFPYVGETAVDRQECTDRRGGTRGIPRGDRVGQGQSCRGACPDHDLSEIAEGGGRHPSAADVSGHDHRGGSEVLARRDEGAGSSALRD